MTRGRYRAGSYRETGSGWQTRLNADLRKARKLGALKTARS